MRVLLELKTFLDFHLCFGRIGFTFVVANFFVDHGKMRFAVNIESAHRARLQVSSRLLGLATIVKDEPHVR